MMAERVLGETMYAILRNYEHGLPHWEKQQGRSTSWVRLCARGYIRRAHSHSYMDGLYVITDAGRQALAAYRKRWDIGVIL